MQLGRLTKALLILPTTALLLVTAHFFLADIPEGQSRRAASHILLTFLASYFFSFAGVASASNTMKTYPATKTVQNISLTWYGLVPHLFLCAFIISGLVAAILDFASST